MQKSKRKPNFWKDHPQISVFISHKYKDILPNLKWKDTNDASSLKFGSNWKLEILQIWFTKCHCIALIFDCFEQILGNIFWKPNCELGIKKYSNSLLKKSNLFDSIKINISNHKNSLNKKYSEFAFAVVVSFFFLLPCLFKVKKKTMDRCKLN